MRRSVLPKAPIACAGSVNSSRETLPLSLIEVASLSDAQRSQLATYGGRWADIRASTGARDRAAAEEGVVMAYAAAALAPPSEIRWVNGPLELARDWTDAGDAPGKN